MWALEPYVSVRQTITDNQRHQTDKESDAITEATAGARLIGTGGRVRGFADYALTGSVYARNNDANELRHFLNAAATARKIRQNVHQQSSKHDEAAAEPSPRTAVFFAASIALLAIQIATLSPF